MTFCVGLTGGIASGKSHVSMRYATRGVPVLDADEVAREVVAPGSEGLAAILAAFGSEALTADGSLDRPAMRRRVFSDAHALRRLEAITHPLIHRRVAAWRAGLDAPYGIYSAAILLESGMQTLVDRVLVVDAPEAVQLARLVARDHHDEVLARRMIAAQASRRERLARADDVLDNARGDTTIEPQIERLHTLYLNLATASAPD